jgi:L-2-hydroxyglutarate oxidase LhgO
VSHQQTDVETVDAVVIGAGVVGLAIARALAVAGREVVVFEAEPTIGAHSSSRSSEVIHAGLYHPAGSLKARLCVAGRRALYDYCGARGIAHRRIGKLLVATTDDEIQTLASYKLQAEQSGVDDLRWVDAAEAQELEPAVRCVRGLLSPSTGIVDSRGLLQALHGDARAHGAEVVLGTKVARGEVGGDAGIAVETAGLSPGRVRCRTLVNAGGLHAQAVAARLDGLPPTSIPPAHYAKGHYFVLAGRSPFRRLVYPVAAPGGLGVHVTLDLAGLARFGPDVSWVDGVDYAFDEGRASHFYAEIRRYWPALPDGALRPGYTGVRPKLGPSGSPPQDFVIQGPAEHGVPGLINLYGIESPGLTASLAIAEAVVSVAS